MEPASVTFPAPAPELDTAAVVEYIQWLVDHDLDSHEPRVLPAFNFNAAEDSQELRDITITSVLVRESDVNIYFTKEYAASFEAPSDEFTESPGHVITGQSVDSDWVFPVRATYRSIPKV